MSNSSKDTRRIIAIVILAIVASLIGYGIYSWTERLKLQEQKRILQEAAQTVLREEGETGLLELAGIAEDEDAGPLSIIADALSVFSSEGYADYSAEEQENIDIYEQFNKAVVHITTQMYSYNTILDAVPEKGTGSGCIIDQEGHIVTNYHLVDDAEEVYVSLYDGTSYDGEIIGLDKENDLAIIKIEPKGENLTTIEFGTSKNLKIGQKVLAIGNPFGYDRTLTEGIVSGLNRPIKTDANLIMLNMIQTDASINPGNSGGPLLDSHGKMIGLNTTIYTTTGSSMGIGFAVPVDTAIRIIPELIEYGKVVRGWIDISPVQLDSRISSYGDLPVDAGILVSKVEAGGKAEESGIRGGSEKVKYGELIFFLDGDIIVEIGGIEISDFADYFSALESTKPGDTIDIVVLRGDKRIALDVELVDRPQQYEWNN